MQYVHLLHMMFVYISLVLIGWHNTIIDLSIIVMITTVIITQLICTTLLQGISDKNYCVMCDNTTMYVSYSFIEQMDCFYVWWDSRKGFLSIFNVNKYLLNIIFEEIQWIAWLCELIRWIFWLFMCLWFCLCGIYIQLNVTIFRFDILSTPLDIDI